MSSDIPNNLHIEIQAEKNESVRNDHSAHTHHREKNDKEIESGRVSEWLKETQRERKQIVPYCMSSAIYAIRAFIFLGSSPKQWSKSSDCEQQQLQPKLTIHTQLWCIELNCSKRHLDIYTSKHSNANCMLCTWLLLSLSLSLSPMKWKKKQRPNTSFVSSDLKACLFMHSQKKRPIADTIW